MCLVLLHYCTSLDRGSSLSQIYSGCLERFLWHRPISWLIYFFWWIDLSLYMFVLEKEDLPVIWVLSWFSATIISFFFFFFFFFLKTVLWFLDQRVGTAYVFTLFNKDAVVMAMFWYGTSNLHMSLSCWGHHLQLCRDG